MTDFQNMEKWSLFFLLDQRKYMVRLFFIIVIGTSCFYFLIYLLLYVVFVKVWTILKMGQASQLTTTPRSLWYAGILMRISITTVTTLLTVGTFDYLFLSQWFFCKNVTVIVASMNWELTKTVKVITSPSGGRLQLWYKLCLLNG